MTSTPNEYTLVEKPILDILVDQYGYGYVRQEEQSALRDRENEVLFRPLLVDALMKINDIPRETAESICEDLANLTDNQAWLDRLRGEFSRQPAGEDKHRPMRLIDFDDLTNNSFVCTNQLRVQGETTRIPDVVIYVNGIPLVVLEAKSPMSTRQNAFHAIDQIKTLEREVPRLFHPNLFNIATNDKTFRFGPTGAPPDAWSGWRDPWPRSSDEFFDETEKGLYALLEPSRLLDILAHFTVFETRDGKTTKKICRYQQYRAVGKMVNRVLDGEHQAGLVWHTQGSGKSLTMVFAALKLKFHLGIDHERLQNPNLLVLTDRLDLHDQISKTFRACGLPNPTQVGSIRELKANVVPRASGRTLLATIFQFHWDEPGLLSDVKAERQAALRSLEVPGSENWILMVDEAHRTQEKDLGAYVRAILPRAVRFGFTGTPVKKGYKNTYQTFGAPGEIYLDKYGIDDAVADGATVPIFYQGRLTEWHLHDKELDVLFDQWFAEEPEDKVEEIKRRGVTKEDLARFEPRIDLIAHDIWAHYRAHLAPDGFKAQVVAIDRLACVEYKKALDRVIARSLRTTEGLGEAEARARAEAMSVCIYSPGPNDAAEHPELVRYQVPPDDVSKKIKPRFEDPDDPLVFLIVCNKLLTGFDAPIEQAMYLDNPLTDHTLLQAIARTNRPYGEAKEHGLVVDYIGVSQKLDEALSAYRREDVDTALRDLDVLADRLRAAHREVMEMLDGLERTGDAKADARAAVEHLGTLDRWFLFRSRAAAFLSTYGALSPDPRTLVYQADMKFVGSVLPYGRLHFEQEEETDWRRYSEKVRAMLREHLEVTGLRTVCKLRSLTDPEFWKDFDSPEDLKTAAVRKLTELKKVTRERSARHPARYERFSDRVKELIEQFNQGLLAADEVLRAAREVAEGVRAEDDAHQGSRLDRRAYGIHAILESFGPEAGELGEKRSVYDGEHEAGQDEDSGREPTELEKAALEIDALYASDDTAPPHWQEKSQLKKSLRRRVRRLVMGLGLDDWTEKVPREIEDYAVLHYAKP